MSSLQLISANEVEVKEVQWLWYPYIPYGKITLLQGDPGDGQKNKITALSLPSAPCLPAAGPCPFSRVDSRPSA